MDNKKDLQILAKSLAGIHRAAFGNLSKSFSSSFILSLIQNSNVIVIKQEQKGFCLARLLDKESEIITIAIKPKFQKKGIGYSLLIRTIQIIKDTQCEKVFLEVASDNLAGIKLYSRAGFKRCGIRKNYYQISKDKKIDALIMNKSLVTRLTK